MHEHYVVVPGWMVRQQPQYASAEEAAVAASELVAHDRVPRAVLKLCSEVQAMRAPRVTVVQVAGAL